MAPERFYISDLLIVFFHIGLIYSDVSACRNCLWQRANVGSKCSHQCSSRRSGGTRLSQARCLLQANNSHLAAWLPSIFMNREPKPGTFRNVQAATLHAAFPLILCQGSQRRERGKSHNFFTPNQRPATTGPLLRTNTPPLYKTAVLCFGYIRLIFKTRSGGGWVGIASELQQLLKTYICNTKKSVGAISLGVASRSLR